MELISLKNNERGPPKENPYAVYSKCRLNETVDDDGRQTMTDHNSSGELKTLDTMDQTLITRHNL